MIKLVVEAVQPEVEEDFQELIPETEIRFRPLKSDRKDNSVSAIVRTKTKGRIFRFEEDVGLKLVALGVATVKPFDLDLERNSAYKVYYAALLGAEESAQKKRLGVWKAPSSSSSLLERMKNKYVGRKG